MGNDNNPLDEIYKLLSQSPTENLAVVIQEKRKEMGDISDNQIANILGIPKTTFYNLMKDINADALEKVDFFDILKVCQFFGIAIEKMSQFFVSSLKAEHIGHLDTARKANYIIRNFDLKTLKELKFISDISDIKSIEKRITEFFKIESIFDYSDEVGEVLFSRTANKSHDKMREFWVRSAYYQFDKINNPNSFDKERLLAILPKIRPYTMFEDKGYLTVLQALYNVGITVIVQSYLPKTQVRGGTFYVKEKPCIVITDLNKTYAGIWFALLHELYHVIYDLEELKTWKYHLTGEPDLTLFKEDFADYFSHEMLFSKEKLDYIKHMIDVPQLVNEYAQENKVHSSIIYSFFCFEEKKKNYNFYPLYQKYFGKPTNAIRLVKTDPMTKKTIDEEVEKVKHILETIIE